MVKNGLAPIHPGAFLRATSRDIGRARYLADTFARAIGVAPMRISHVVTGGRPVSAELALLFGRALGQARQCCLNLQGIYDLKMAERSIGARLRAVIALAPTRVAGSY